MLTGMMSTAIAAGIKVCLTNSYGEQASLVFMSKGGGDYDVSGTYNYQIFGGTIWSVSGTFSTKTHKLHFVATNPDPHNCLDGWADYVTFDYTCQGNGNFTGSFRNDCGNAGSLTATAVKGDCGYRPVTITKGEFGSTGSSKMVRTQIVLPKGEDLLKILAAPAPAISQNNSKAPAGIPVCVVNDFGEQSSLVATQVNSTLWAITGSIDYRFVGSTIWPVKGVYDNSKKHLHYVATNPNPDHCVNFADKVTFDYNVSGTSLSGHFSNDCGVYGPLNATASRGDCGYSALKLRNEEYGSTGSTKMQRSRITLPPGEALDKILAERIITISPNPAVQSTQISFTLNTKSKVTLQIYDEFGNLNCTLAKDVLLNEGKHNYTWNLRTDKGYAAQRGTYWVKAITSEGVMMQRILVMQ